MKTDHHPLSWASGYLDSTKGHFNIRRTFCKKAGHYINYHIAIHVTHKKLVPLLTLNKLFGGTIQNDLWACTSQKAYQACLRLVPQLVVKTDQAELLITFQDECIGQKGRKIYEHEHKAREQYFQILQKMKRES